MFDFSKYKTILIWVGVIVILFFAYSYFFVKKDTTASGPSVLVVNKASVSDEERNMLQLLADMQSIRLDTSILQDNAFLNLQDFSVPLQDEPRGRTNPFAPIGNTGAASVSQSTSSPSTTKKGI
jgi:hypothetical protein